LLGIKVGPEGEGHGDGVEFQSGFRCIASHERVTEHDRTSQNNYISRKLASAVKPSSMRLVDHEEERLCFR
jgi:hypothetical protein